MNSNVSEGRHQNIGKWKKKRSITQKLKKRFQKSDTHFRGQEVDQTEIEYFLRVFQLERVFEGTPEEKAIFANNALAQTEKHEVEYSFNQLVSRVIESLLPLASNEVLEKYFEAFGVNLRPICVNSFASHVLQGLMITAARHSLKETAEAEDTHTARCRSWLLKVSRFLLNNIEEFIWDTYANPVLRTALVCLAGMPHLDRHDKGENNTKILTDCSVKKEISNPPEEFLQLLYEFHNRNVNFPQMKDYVDNPLTSGFLQSLLIVLSQTDTKKYRSLCKKILADCFPTSMDENSSVMFSPTALPVLEVIVERSKEKTQKKIFKNLLSGRLTEMCTARVPSVTIQKFLNKCNNPEIVAEILKAVAPLFQDMLAFNNTGIVVSLCQACQRLNTAQSEFVQAMMKVLKCDGSDKEPDQLVPAILSLTPLPHDSVPSATKYGSLLLQAMLKFQKPISLVNSLLSYKVEELVSLLSSQYGSFITGAFCKSEFIGEKSRLKLIKKLMGHYPELAKSKFGSRSFDDLWEVSELKSKVQIVQDLTAGHSTLMSTECGAFVARKVQLDIFRTQGVDRWTGNIQRIHTKKKLFAPIIGDVK